MGALKLLTLLLALVLLAVSAGWGQDSRVRPLSCLFAVTNVDKYNYLPDRVHGALNGSIDVSVKLAEIVLKVDVLAWNATENLFVVAGSFTKTSKDFSPGRYDLQGSGYFETRLGSYFTIGQKYQCRLSLISASTW